MTLNTQYYAIVGRGRAPSNPSGLARRTNVNGNEVDESLQRDLTWGPTSAIAEWNRGEDLTRDLVEISEDDAQALIQRFREKWAQQDS